MFAIAPKFMYVFEFFLIKQYSTNSTYLQCDYLIY